MKEPAIVLLNPKDNEDNELKVVQALRYRTILFKNQVTLEEALSVDVPVEVDLNKENEVLKYVFWLKERFDIRAVFTLNEYRVPLAARISEELGLSGISYPAAQRCRNKKLTREKLNEHQVSSVRFIQVREEKEVEDVLASFELPVIVKPSNGSGSNNVRLCYTVDDVKRAVRIILKGDQSFVPLELDPEMLIEEFLDGPEFSVEACTVHGTTTILAITEKYVTPFPYTTEVGHRVPAILPEQQIKAISQLVKDGLRALEVDQAVTHTEVKWTVHGPKIIEVNGRPGGDEIPKLVRAVTGYDLCELSLHFNLGGTLQNAPRHEPIATSASTCFLIAEQDGIVSFQPRIQHPLLQELNIFVEQGEEVTKTTSNFNRLGYFIVYGTGDSPSEQAVSEVLELIDLKVKQPVANCLC